MKNPTQPADDEDRTLRPKAIQTRLREAMAAATAAVRLALSVQCSVIDMSPESWSAGR